ncbi:metal-dependent transcriptional regulator [bacterium]|nr:metal-dependent transcriptional regulator [bacterium]
MANADEYNNQVQIGTLTESLEDYLEIILRLVQTNKVARVRDIAKAKDVKTSSAISALQRLSKEGLVDYRAREYVDLTEAGRELAFRLNQRHDFLKRFLMDLLQVDPETAEDDACAMEHVISVTTLDRIVSLSEFLTYCPRGGGGDTISQFRDCWLNQSNDGGTCKDFDNCGLWRRKFALENTLGIRGLRELLPGEEGYIARIMGNGGVREGLIRRGFLPATGIKLVHHAQDNSSEVVISNETRTLKEEEVRAVFVWVRTKVDARYTKGDNDTAIVPLSDLAPGDRFKVRRIRAKGEIRQRLLDMGLIRGSTGQVLREALLRDPIEIRLKGYLLSLRRSEASDILVEEIDE